MALPGLSFEIVDAAEPFVGLRSDRVALIAQTQRGPVESPTLVHSLDEFAQRFGHVIPGTLGAIAARQYFANGGRELVVCRFASESHAARATGTLPFVDDATQCVSFELREPGSFGDAVEIVSTLERSKAAVGNLLSSTTLAVSDSAVAASLAGLAIRLNHSAGGHWVLVSDVADKTVTFSPGVSISTSSTVTIEGYARTFSLRIREPARSDVVIDGLDLRDIDGVRKALEPFGIGITSVDAGSSVLLPQPGLRERLTGGDDGLGHISLEERRASFLRCLAALEASDLPDIVIAPDLWSAIWGTRESGTAGFLSGDAVALGDELVRSAARTRDRIVILDPPLSGGYTAKAQSAVRPAAVSEIEKWRAARGATLGADRDFAATFAPWVRVVEPPRFRGDDTLLVPPSAALAGRMAETARRQGAWVATGNVALAATVGLSQVLTTEDEARLQDIGVSPLRTSFPRGATVQGVRSLSWPDRKAWGFISTRRLFNFLRRALRPIGLSYTFEPNAPATWMQLRRDLERIFDALFARGALAGSVPSEAYFVRIDAALNPEEAREAGVLTALIGAAPAVPLEFVVVRLTLDRGVFAVAEDPIVS